MDVKQRVIDFLTIYCKSQLSVVALNGNNGFKLEYRLERLVGEASGLRQITILVMPEHTELFAHCKRYLAIKETEGSAAVIKFREAVKMDNLTDLFTNYSYDLLSQSDADFIARRVPSIVSLGQYKLIRDAKDTLLSRRLQNFLGKDPVFEILIDTCDFNRNHRACIVRADGKSDFILQCNVASLLSDANRIDNSAIYSNVCDNQETSLFEL